MEKINFTAEHKAKLEALLLVLVFSGRTLQGKFGANSINPWQAVNTTSISTLKTLKAQLKKDIDALSEEDEWSMSNATQRTLDDYKDWYDFINLCIGYRLSLSQAETIAREIRKLEAEREELRKENLTPEEQLKELDAKIAALKA